MQNKLSPEEIVLFYEFLNCYENNLKQLKNDKSFGIIAKEFKTRLGEFNININVVSKGKVPLFNSINSNEIFMTSSKNSQMISFLRHLRNSIAHCLLKRVDSKYQISDKIGQTLAMNGNVNAQYLKDLINLFIKNFKI
jgi:hypothetical protein